MNDISGGPATADMPGEPKLRWSFVALAWFTAFAVTAIVLGEMMIADLGFAWALHGTFNLSTQSEIIIAAIGGAGCLWLSFLFFRAVLSYELAAARQGPETGV